MRTIIDFHVLQTVPPSNLNRDDTGSPKTAVFGGHRRARVSSQAWKRATRLAFADELDPAHRGVRTKRVVEVVAEEIERRDPSLVDSADGLAQKCLGAADIKLADSKRKAADGSPIKESGYLMFLSRPQIEGLAEIAVNAARQDDVEAAIKASHPKQIANSRHSVALALFGRMVAGVPELNVDASCQVAHALSVHAVDTEYDFFTAVDDEKSSHAEEDAGAGMMGTVEFNSSTLYRYATVDVDRLHETLGGDADLTARAVQVFADAFVTSMPTGKQNTFANRTLPDMVMVTTRDRQPVNLVGAFEEPIPRQSQGTIRANAARRLADHAKQLDDAFGASSRRTWVVGVADTAAELTKMGEQANLPAMLDGLGDYVRQSIGEPR